VRINASDLVNFQRKKSVLSHGRRAVGERGETASFRDKADLMALKSLGSLGKGRVGASKPQKTLALIRAMAGRVASRRWSVAGDVGWARRANLAPTRPYGGRR